MTRWSTAHYNNASRENEAHGLLNAYNWNLETLVFEERGKPEYPVKNLSEQRREPTKNSTHIGERRALSPLRHPCYPKIRESVHLPTSYLDTVPVLPGSRLRCSLNKKVVIFRN